MFQKPFSFEGRIRRTEYGISIIIYVVIAIIINSIGAIGKGPVIVYIAYIPLFWFLFAQGAKRCHDRSNSGWYQIIPFYVFWMIFADSNYGINEYGLNSKLLGNSEQSEIVQKGQIIIPSTKIENEPKIDVQQKESNIAIKLRVIFHKPIIKETISKPKVTSSWEPETYGWVSVEDNGLTIFGSSKFSLLEKSLSGMPFFGPVFIKTLFSSIRDKKRNVPYKNIYKLVAATRPHRSSMWDGGDTECGIIHILFESTKKRSDVCAFSESTVLNHTTILSAFWKSCSIKLGADKLDIRDEAIKKTLQINISD